MQISIVKGEKTSLSTQVGRGVNKNQREFLRSNLVGLVYSRLCCIRVSGLAGSRWSRGTDLIGIKVSLARFMILPGFRLRLDLCLPWIAGLVLLVILGIRVAPRHLSPGLRVPNGCLLT